MARRRKGERVLGPYSQRGKWRIIVVRAGGEKVTEYYDTEAEAQQVVRSLFRAMKRAVDRTVEEAMKEYEVYLRDDKQNKPRSIEDTRWRLRQYFVELDAEGKVLRNPADIMLSGISAERGVAFYDALRRRRSERTKRPLSVDSHRNILAEAKTFLRWCVGKKWLSRNPLEEVRGIGKRHKGKEQLRIDEARRWLAKALELADDGEGGAIAAMMALVMGMRASEIVTRIVRDIDDEGRLLVIPASKTEAGKRQLQIPELVQPLVKGLAEGKGPRDLLFGYHDRDWVRDWVQRICKMAGVPMVTAHGMRGLHGTLATERGITGQVVALALGHESVKTTFGNYVQAEAVATAQQRRALTVLQGGRQGA
jgi:integrase